MDYKKEIGRRDKKIEELKNKVREMEEEISAMRELLDCAAANLMVAVHEKGEKLLLSKKEVSDTLGKFSLTAKDDGEGNYVLEITKCQT